MEFDCQALITERIRQSGPITVADFMDLALYAPETGYYARAAQRTGRAGDFITSVDASPLFGELLAFRFREIWRAFADSEPSHEPGAEDQHRNHSQREFMLVEAGAGNGRLSRDILEAAARVDPAFYEAITLHLVERSAVARAAQPGTLGPHASKLHSSSADLPSDIAGVLFANELLDAFPVHLVAMTPDGLREIYVDVEDGTFIGRLGLPSTPRLEQYFDDLGIALQQGAQVEVNLAAVDWIRQAAHRLTHGSLILIDYGYEARAMYEGAGAVGTLTTFQRHLADLPGAGRSGNPAWLEAPGTRDLTTHVDFTTVRREAGLAGLSAVSMTSQSRFLLDLVDRSGLVQDLSRQDRLRDRMALKTLVVPGGLGSSHTVLEFAKLDGSGTGGPGFRQAPE